jgi:hypothetical protein
VIGVGGEEEEMFFAIQEKLQDLSLEAGVEE